MGRSQKLGKRDTHTHTHTRNRAKSIALSTDKLGLKAQSAMEYLMTYGWAILIIAIVLVALFSLNLFNPYTFAPKASADSCQIMRPNGPGSNIFVSEVGLCNDEIPQYVAKFNGVSSNIQISTSISANPPLTFTAWVYPKSGGVMGIVTYYTGIWCGGDAYGIGLQSYYLYAWPGCFAPPKSATTLTPNAWNFVAASIQGPNEETLYINNQKSTNTISVTYNSLTTFYLDIGLQRQTGAYFNGSISNVQIYNTSLSANEITALYNEGIGGAPVDIQNLVGWWPLNGNAKDYSGNNNNGVPTNVIYTSNWGNGYSTP